MKTIALDLEVVSAHSLRERMRGLLGWDDLDGRAMWIARCKQVHTAFMRVPLGIAFLDEAGAVVHCIQEMRPWRISRVVWRAYGVLEMSPEALQEHNVQLGDKLAWMNH